MIDLMHNNSLHLNIIHMISREAVIGVVVMVVAHGHDRFTALARSAPVGRHELCDRVTDTISQRNG